MYRKLNYLLVLALVLCITGSAFSAEMVWDDGGTDHLWSTPENWAGDVKPGTDDYAMFEGTGHVEGTINSTESIFVLRVGYNATTTDATLNTTTGSNLTASSGCFVGFETGSNGVIKMAGGSVTSSGYLYAGYQGTGTITVSGGMFAMSAGARIGGHGATGLGTLNIDGGSVSSGADLEFGNVGVGHCNVSNGGSLSSSAALLFGINGGSSTLNMTGGTVSSGSVTIVGNNGSSVWNMDGGIFNGGGADTIIGHAGNGTLNMTGGTINCLDAYFEIGREGTSVGHVQLDDGTINAKSFRMRLNGGAGTMDVTEGVMNVEGDWVDAINGYVSNGWLTGYGSGDNVVVSYDGIGEITTVTAVPEPATMILLGLGSLALIRRKRA